MYKGKRVSVVMPAYNEEEGAPATVRGFKSHPWVDEVIVCDNKCSDKTAEKSKLEGAIIVTENRQGYGYSCQKALSAATGDLIVLTESDDSFFPEDLEILFVYLDHFDIVKGARSNIHMVTADADWTFSMMFANWVVAKYLQILFFGTKVFEDMSQREVGGTFRVIKRDAYTKIQPYFKEVRHAFLPDMTTIGIAKGLKIIEVPVRYRRRLGESKGTGNRIRAFFIALRMTYVISRNRLKHLFNYYE